MMRRLGIWAANGNNPAVDKMLAMRPGMITVIYDYWSHNQIDRYLTDFPDGELLIRFMHPKNWHENPTESANNYAAEILRKLPQIDAVGARWYFWNELNLHYENGWGFDRQVAIETPEFYRQLANWTFDVIDRVKQNHPETRAVMPPFAFGHGEDGAPEQGQPKAGWAGYDYFADMIHTHFDDTVCGHFYWGDGSGAHQRWLYDADLSSWYAFRWRRVWDLFAVRYGNPDARIIIDECGNFQPDLATFPDDMIYYAEECLRDERISGVTPFLWADPTGANAINSWQRIPTLDDFVARLGTMKDISIDKFIETTPPVIPPEQGDKMYQILDINGNEQDEQWLAAHWGVEVSDELTHDYPDNFRLIRVREREGAAIYPIIVLDKNGLPLSGRLVWRHYPSAPDNWVSAPNVPEPPEAHSAVYGVTKDNGFVEFGLGTGDYAGPGDGVTSIWVTQNDVGTDIVRKMGMLPNTNHRTLELTFQWIVSGDEITPPVEPPVASDCSWFCKLLRALTDAFCKDCN